MLAQQVNEPIERSMLAQQVNLLATYAIVITLVSLHTALHRSIIFYLDVGRSLGDLRAARRSRAGALG